MKVYLITFIIFFTSIVYGQSHTSVGGGGGGGLDNPDFPSTDPVILEKICKEKTLEAQTLEKIFTEEYTNLYTDEKSFFILLEIISLELSIKSVEFVNFQGTKYIPSCGCEKKELLRKILVMYENTPDKICSSFHERKKKIDLIKFILDQM